MKRRAPRPSLILATATTAIGLAVAACHPVPPSSSSAKGYVTAGYSTLWPASSIPVCWDNVPTPDPDADGRTAVQNAVTSAYAQNGLGFNFTGWGPCQPGDKGVHITVQDALPRVAGYGAWLDGVVAGVTLNFHFQTSGNPACQADDHRLNCIASYGIHEFGHVLGLRHEANRPDNNCPAQDQTGGIGEAGAFAVNAYDSSSVMNYCRLNNDLQQASATILSAGDISTLQQYYNRQLTFPGPDQGAACSQDAGVWDSVSNCCRLADGWTPTAPVPYRSCGLPPASQQAAACTLANGQWDAANSCCRADVPQGILTRWNTFYHRCL